MIRGITGTAFVLWSSILCSQAQATHIQYVDLGDVTNASLGADKTRTWEFDLVNDSMHLWEIDTPTSTFGPTPDVTTADYTGSYDPLYDLHYVTLRIDPNNYTGDPTSDFLKLEVNGTEIDNWSNPISLYDWGVPGTSISDLYGIADASNNYKITVTLTGLSTLTNGKTITIDNVNLEGCFDTANPVPEPATMLLFGGGLACLAGWSRKKTFQIFRH